MSSLIEQAKGRLAKAADATRDPADLTASQSASIPASENASHTASNAASGTASHAASDVASDSGSDAASGAAGTPKPAPTRGETPPPATTKTPGKRKKKTPPRRRVGRPAGPARVALSVRILPRLDAGLTTAVNATGMSPQYVVEAALQDWLTRHGHLPDHP